MFWAVTVYFGKHVCYSETLVPVYQTTRCPIPDDCSINTHCHVNLRLYIRCIYSIYLLFNGFGATDNTKHLLVPSGLSVCPPGNSTRSAAPIWTLELGIVVNSQQRCDCVVLCQLGSSDRKFPKSYCYSYLYYLPNIVLLIKSRRMRWAGHVARMG
jgi:hypothetical protein